MTMTSSLSFDAQETAHLAVATNFNDGPPLTLPTNDGASLPGIGVDDYFDMTLYKDSGGPALQEIAASTDDLTKLVDEIIAGTSEEDWRSVPADLAETRG